MAQPRRWTLVLVLGFCLAVASAFFFGYRAGRTARQFRWQNEPIRPWMSVPFVAHTYHTNPQLLFQAIHVDSDPRDRRSIREIAQEEKQPVGKLIGELQDAITKANRSGAEGTPPPQAR